MPKTHNDFQDMEIEELKDEYKICADHIAIVNEELGNCKTNIAIIKTILERHDKLLWIVVAGIVGIILKLFIVN